MEITPEIRKQVMSELGQKGGYARAKTLTAEQRMEISIRANVAKNLKVSPERRKEIAKIANKARWVNHKK